MQYRLLIVLYQKYLTISAKTNKKNFKSLNAYFKIIKTDIINPIFKLIIEIFL